MWEHPTIKAINFQTADNEKARNKIKKQLEQEVETDADGDVIVPAFLSDSSCPADLKSIYRHLTKEQDSWQRPTYTLRHTLTFSPEYNYAASVVQRAYSYVNYIITPAQLTGNATIGEPTLDAAITTSITNAQTNSLPAGVNSGTGQQTIDGITHQWGWLKSAPKIVSEGRRKITLTQEWKLELWSTWIYTVAS